MHRTQRLPITAVNELLCCGLCAGYLVDATAITECPHSFCRACIVRHFEKGNKNCPRCNVQLHGTKPLEYLMPDNTLQGMVYKLVPGLYKREMNRRKEWYANIAHSHYDLHMGQEVRGDVPTDLYDVTVPQEEFVSLVLQHCAFLPPLNERGSWDQKLLSDKNADTKYLRCPANVTLSALRKFVRNKYDLDPKYEVDLFYSDEGLRDHYTLSDVAFIYGWTKDAPLKIFYLVYDSTKEKSPIPYYKATRKTRKRRVRKRKQSSVDSIDSEEETAIDEAAIADKTVALVTREDEQPTGQDSADDVMDDVSTDDDVLFIADDPARDGDDVTADGDDVTADSDDVTADVPMQLTPVETFEDKPELTREDEGKPAHKAADKLADKQTKATQGAPKRRPVDKPVAAAVTCTKDKLNNNTTAKPCMEAKAGNTNMSSSVVVEETPSEVVQVNGRYTTTNGVKRNTPPKQMDSPVRAHQGRPPLDGLQKLVNNTLSVPQPARSHAQGSRAVTSYGGPSLKRPLAERGVMAVPQPKYPAEMTSSVSPPAQLRADYHAEHVRYINNNMKLGHMASHMTDLAALPASKRQKCNHANGVCEGHDPLERLLEAQAQAQEHLQHGISPSMPRGGGAHAQIRTPDPRMCAFARVPGPRPPGHTRGPRAQPNTGGPGGPGGYPGRVPPGRHHVRTRPPMGSPLHGNHGNLQLHANMNPGGVAQPRSSPGELQQQLGPPIGAYGRAKAHPPHPSSPPGPGSAMHRLPQTLYPHAMVPRYSRPLPRGALLGPLRACVGKESPGASSSASLSPGGDGWNEPLDFTMKRQDNESPVSPSKSEGSPPGPTLLRVPTVTR